MSKSKDINYRISPDEYAKILKNIELISISLISINALHNYKSVSMDSLQIKVGTVVDSFDAKGIFIEIPIKHTLTAIPKNRKKAIITIDVNHLVKIVSTEEFTNDFFQLYKNVSLPFVVCPFFREIVHNTVLRMELPPLMLPLLKSIKD